MATLCLEAMDSLFQRRMWDDKDIEAELEEEIRDELDKICVSSLEIRDETESPSEDSKSDSGEEDLPESVLYCINFIKNRGKNAENLVLQDLEDTDISSSRYGAVSNNPPDFLDKLTSNYYENRLELKNRLLLEIEKEIQINTVHKRVPNFTPVPELVDEPFSSDDADSIKLEYHEVEERCRQSFAAWEMKQRELEDEENEKFRAQKEREEKELQEVEEKRHCRLKQFEEEKKKIENIHKLEEEKIKIQLQQQQKLWEENLKEHEEFFRRLQLQVEEERRGLEDLKAKERQRLADLQQNAAIKIQARYRTFVAYQKYGSIIKERLKNKKEKEMLKKQKQEWKEMTDKIRQKDKERKKKIEERLNKQEEIKGQKLKEQANRQEEYEKKKEILKLKREQQKLMEETKKREKLSVELIMSKANQKSEESAKELLVKKENKKQESISKEISVNIFTNKKDKDTKPLVEEESNEEEVLIIKRISSENVLKRINIAEKEPMQKIKQESCWQNISRGKHITAAFKKEQNKNLGKYMKPVELQNENKPNKCNDFIKSQEKTFEENMTNYLELEQEREKGCSVDQDNRNKWPVGQKDRNKHPVDQNDRNKRPVDQNDRNECPVGQNDRNECPVDQNDRNECPVNQNDRNECPVDQNDRNECPEAREDGWTRNTSGQDRKKLNQEDEDSKMIKEEKEKNESQEEREHFGVSLNHMLSFLKVESKENPISSGGVAAPSKEGHPPAVAKEESSETNIRTDGETIILNTSDIVLNVENNLCSKKSATFTAASEDLVGDSDKSSSMSENSPSVMGEAPKEFCGHGAEGEGRATANSLKKMSISTLVEEKRLAWIKTCRPWLEIFRENQRKKVVKRNRPRKCTISNLPALNAATILQGGLWSTLQQVTTVTFQDLPSCGLCTLSECTNLQFLSLRHCGLTALEGLNNCKQLKYIDVQENQIQVINCENLENLCILLLNNNELTSFHGLDGCSNLRNIEVSNNKITRIGGLESLKSLQQLIVDHNQLMSTRGLCSVPTIMYLDCSYNNLTKVEGIKDCGLLQILKLQGNYLTEIPSLENHVLLRELHLDDNSISTLEIFSSYWLPLLQILTISQNSLTEIVPLFQFISLEKLDVSNNCLSDLKGVAKWFDACFNLCDLSLNGNPLLQERNWRQSVLEILPTLKILNGEMLKSDSLNHEINMPEPSSFSATCQTQAQEFDLLIKKMVTEKRNIQSLDTLENFCCYFNDLMELSNEYRYVHEHRDFRIIDKGENLNIMKRNQSEVQHGHLKQASSNSLQQNYQFIIGVNQNAQLLEADSSDSGLLNLSSIEKVNQDQRVQRRKCNMKNKIHTKNNIVTEALITSEMEKDCQQIQNDARNQEATVIQSDRIGYPLSRQINFLDKRNMAAMIIQRTWRKYRTRIQMNKIKSYNSTIHSQREKAATLIQAVWKGFLLRKKLARALASIKSEELEDEYEEIDLEDFTYNEAALEKEWFSLDSTNFPSKTQALPNELHQPKYLEYCSSDEASFNLPPHPEQAWQCNERDNPFSPEDFQYTDRSESQKLFSSSDSKNSMKMYLKSKKEEKISEEWGFKDISTAQLVLKRAQKMKSKKAKQKLDPAVRLALFKNNGNKQSSAKPAKKAQQTRQGYFEDRGDEEGLKNMDVPISSDKVEHSKDLTYQWLHTQVGTLETTCPRNVKSQPHFLPVLDPDVLNGGRVQLVARIVRREDMDVDLVSMNSGSALAQNREKNNQPSRHSAESSFKVIAVPGGGNTKKKWASHRDYSVKFSDGWESGKRKAKTFN